MWLVLRDRRLAGYKFRRQRPIGPYIVDFVSIRHRLVIEVDGSLPIAKPMNGVPLGSNSTAGASFGFGITMCQGILAGSLNMS